MATVKDFKDQIGAQFMASAGARKHYDFPDGATFDSYFPTVSVESILLYVFAFGMWVLASLFDQFTAEVQALLTELKPHTLRWYVTKAKAYQHCCQLPKDETGQTVSDVYDVIEPKAQVVKYAVAQETGGLILIKVAKYSTATDPTPQKLTDNELAGLKGYFSQIKDAGVPVAIISNNPDRMTIDVAIFYNPMLLFPDVDSATGKVTALKNGDGVDVVRAAIEQVIENLPFNGDCKTSDILDAIKAVPGVDVADITSVATRGDNGNYTKVVGYSTPQSGYFKLEKLTIASPYSNGNEI